MRVDIRMDMSASKYTSSFMDFPAQDIYMVIPMDGYQLEDLRETCVGL